MDYVKKVLNVEGVIGQGAFGRVLSTSPIQNQTTRYALKCVHPILRPQRLASELRHLRDLGGKCNVVQLHTAHFHKGSLFIVMELIDHDRFVDIIAQLDHEEIVIYMKNLLIALEHVHSQNIIHRDIKPANFLFDRKNRKFLLVDFGLAQKIRTQQLSSKPPIATTTTSPPKMSHQMHRFFIAESPNAPTKRPADAATCSQMLKKLRVSATDESREPVRLTVGAYESPVTNNDSSYRTRNNINDNHLFSTPKIPNRRRQMSARCDCRGKPRTCNTCMSRPDSSASRSGTPGFKAPEVLLRHANQTTAVDIWSAGVIFVCLLAGHSPFFRDTEDSVSLGEIITLFGSHRMTQAAKALGIRLNIEPKREPVDLKDLCKSIRMNSKDKLQMDLPDTAFDLLHKMLDPNPLARVTAKDALEHPWFQLSLE